MKCKILFTLLFVIPTLLFGQTGNEQNAAIPKDAPIDVTVTNFKNVMLNGEIIVFRSQKTDKEYQGLTNEQGKFSLRLPAGDKYEIFILGFKDSTSYNVLDIPMPQGNAYYKSPFKIDIQFQPAKTFVLDDCNFDFGKATLQEGSYAVLDELVAYMNRKADEKIEIGGHTDNIGSHEKNQKLSEDRANTVRAYLLTKGIDPDRVTAKGYGMDEPIEDNSTEEGRAKNRRTEVKILQ